MKGARWGKSRVVIFTVKLPSCEIKVNDIIDNCKGFETIAKSGVSTAVDPKRVIKVNNAM